MLTHWISFLTAVMLTSSMCVYAEDSRTLDTTTVKPAGDVESDAGGIRTPVPTVNGTVNANHTKEHTTHGIPFHYSTNDTENETTSSFPVGHNAGMYTWWKIVVTLVIFCVMAAIILYLLNVIENSSCKTKLSRCCRKLRGRPPAENIEIELEESIPEFIFPHQKIDSRDLDSFQETNKF